MLYVYCVQLKNALIFIYYFTKIQEVINILYVSIITSNRLLLDIDIMAIYVYSVLVLCGSPYTRPNLEHVTLETRIVWRCFSSILLFKIHFRLNFNFFS